MKMPGSKPLFSTELRANHPEMETQVSITPLICKLKALHRVNSLLTENRARQRKTLVLPHISLYIQLVYTWLQRRHKSFSTAFMEIAKQIIKGTHEMGQCTVDSRGVARKRYCWVSQ